MSRISKMTDVQKDLIIIIFAILGTILFVTFGFYRIYDIERELHRLEGLENEAIQKMEWEKESLLKEKIKLENKKLVDFIAKNTPLDKSESSEVVKEINSTLERYKNDPFYKGACRSLTKEHIVAQMLVESSGNKFAYGKAGEIGLMQIIPKWHIQGLHSAGVIKSSNPDLLWDIKTNVKSGIYILMNIARNSNSTETAFAKYNAGNRTHLGMNYARKVEIKTAQLKKINTEIVDSSIEL